MKSFNRGNELSLVGNPKNLKRLRWFMTKNRKRINVDEGSLMDKGTSVPIQQREMGHKTQSPPDTVLLNQMLCIVDKLKNSSSQIELIKNIVDELVIQINLLSLNTAVELENLGISKTGLNIIAKDIQNLSEKSVDDAHLVLSILSETVNNTESLFNIAEAIAEENNS